MRAELTVGTFLITILASPFGKIKDDSHGEKVIFLRESDERLARFRLDIGSVDNCKPSARKSLTNDSVQQVECVASGRLIILVICDQTATKVRRDNRCRKEVLTAERRFSGTGGTHQQYERKLRNCDLHAATSCWEKIAI